MDRPIGNQNFTLNFRCLLGFGHSCFSTCFDSVHAILHVCVKLQVIIELISKWKFQLRFNQIFIIAVLPCTKLMYFIMFINYENADLYCKKITFELRIFIKLNIYHEICHHSFY